MFKLISLLYILLLLSSVSFAQNLSISKNEYNSVVISYELDSYKISTFVINNKTVSKISFKNSQYEKIKDEPSIPFFSKKIITSSLGTNLSIDEISYTRLKAPPPIPSKGFISRTSRPSLIEYKFGKAYSLKKQYPAKFVSIGSTYSIRNITGATVKIYPAVYDMATHEYKILKNIKITLTDRVPSFSPPPISSNGAFTTILRNQFNIPSSNSRVSDISDGDKMIIITADKFIATANQLANWKNIKGISTEVFKYPTETGGNTGSDALKSFISQKYSTDSITYILLIGDIEDIPSPFSSKGLWENQSGYMDPAYIFLSGDDYLPDALIGRLSVSTISEADNFVNKIINYEKYPDATDGSWYAKATGLASNENFEGDLPLDYEWMGKFRDTLLANGFTEVDELYSPNATTAQLVSALNDGRSWISYMGHGNINSWGTTSFTNDSVALLLNNNRLPIAYSVACLVGKFEKECLAEKFTNSTTGGTVAFFGATYNQPWIPPQLAQEQAIQDISHSTFLSIGALLFNSELNMLSMQYESFLNDAVNSTIATWTLFGDPSMTPFTKKPTPLSVSVSPNIDAGNNNTSFNFGENIDGRVAVFSKTTGLLTSKIVRGASTATLSYSTTQDDSLIITVTSLNRVPWQAETIANGTFIKTLDKTTQSGIKLNLTKNSLLLQIDKIGKFNMKIQNLHGRTIANKQITGNNFKNNLQLNLPSGIYFISLTGHNFNYKAHFTSLK